LDPLDAYELLTVSTICSDQMGKGLGMGNYTNKNLRTCVYAYYILFNLPPTCTICYLFLYFIIRHDCNTPLELVSI
jgi:hypothetical protein